MPDSSGLLPFLLGVVSSTAVGFYARPLGTRLGLLDFPDPVGGRKQHGKVTPLVGGLGIFLAVMIGTMLMAAQGHPDVNRSMLLWFAASVTGMFALGVADDRVELSAKLRLFIAAGIMLAAISQVPDFAVSFLLFSGQTQLTLMPGLIGIGFTLLCFVGFLNAVNMADGKNGMVLGQAIIWAGVLYFRMPATFAPLLLAILGSLLILFLFNMRGLLFLGDGGSYALSAMFGLLAIYCWNYGFADMRADDIALLFALPVFDTIRLIGWRLAQGKSPTTPGRDHLHHYLFTRWGWPAPLPWVLALVAIPNMGALLLPGTALLWLMVTLAGYGLMLWFATSHVRTRVA